ncbi:MAG: DUF255 domain-containing protein [Abditibacteriales bacterium]|nr:DUF255 domain-containing protein [Abditibacteriales bacterium]MDW8367575.1 DUF255 domain-containing protein [Abditibacteriales bacterium]
MSHQYTNALIHETSPYLLQHAHNPVNWYPWGAEAIQKARAEDKPIFLSIGYSTCYWCHVMERQSFEDAEVARLLNEHFISIKVDREERPDIDDIYMQATLLFTQGHGGWPMSVFLTPDLKPFHAGTYFPRAQFMLLLQQVADVWRTNRERIEQTARQVAEAIARQTALSAPSAEGLDERLLNFGVQALMEAFDPRYGGFGGAPKFPPHQALRFLWQRYRRTRDDAARRMVVITLEQMARGGIYDQIGGGFARYSTDHRWLVPHFEKMLYDNAQLAPLYAEVFALTKGTYFRRIAEETYNFVLREMTDPQGGFYSALDAESYVAPGSHEKEEGAYYVWTPEEVKQVLGEQDGELFCQIYDITPSGNFEGKSIPNLLNRSVEEWAKQLTPSVSPPYQGGELTPSDSPPYQGGDQEGVALWQWLDEKRRQLLEARQRRPYPHRDDKILTSWNALMIDAFARGYAVLKDERYRQAAENAARFILTHLRDADGRLRRTYRDGQAKLNAYLDDYACLVVALVELHKATEKAEWLQEATAVADKMIELFWDASEGGFFFTSHDHPEQLIAPLKSGFDGAEPSGNGMAALGLLELGRLTGRADFLAKSRQTLEAFGGFLPRAPRGFGTMLYVLDLMLSDGTAPLRTATVAISPDAILRVEVSPDTVTLPPGETAMVSVHLHIKEGWHIQSSQPTLDFLTPTKLEVTSSLPVQVTAIHYPPGQPLQLAFAPEALDAYTGDVTLTVELLADAAAQPQTGALELTLSYQACDETRCLRAAQVPMSVRVRVA